MAYNVSGSKFPTNPKYFKEETIMEILVLDTNMLDIERIVDVMVDPIVTNIQLINTEAGTSNEGQNLTGYKLLVEVLLREKILYVGCQPTQPVQGAHFEVTKVLYIVPPAEIGGISICDLVTGGRIQVKPYIEKVHARVIDCRTIQKCVAIFLDMVMI
ncbi:MAG: hypothetical protein ACRDDX_03045 [Cellulosilyticaceae bacterium]